RRPPPTAARPAAPPGPPGRSPGPSAPGPSGAPTPAGAPRPPRRPRPFRSCRPFRRSRPSCPSCSQHAPAGRRGPRPPAPEPRTRTGTGTRARAEPPAGTGPDPDRNRDPDPTREGLRCGGARPTRAPDVPGAARPRPGSRGSPVTSRELEGILPKAITNSHIVTASCVRPTALVRNATPKRQRWPHGSRQARWPRHTHQRTSPRTRPRTRLMTSPLLPGDRPALRALLPVPLLTLALGAVGTVAAVMLGPEPARGAVGWTAIVATLL